MISAAELHAWTFRKGAPLLFALALAVAAPAAGQGLDSEKSIDAIVGSDVKTDEARKESDRQRVVEAIENSRSTAELVRKAYNIDTLEIVFVPDITEELAKAIAEHEAEITVLRESIEGSAIFYHAVDSRSIMLTNIIAAEFGEGGTVTVFVKGTSDTADRNVETPPVD